MANFDETSGVVVCDCDFGRWWQTISDVNIEITKFDTSTAQRLTSKLCKCTITPKSINIKIDNKTIFEGELYGAVIADDCLWTIEDDGKMLKIVLEKTKRDAGNCWESLLKDGRYAPDPWTLDQMRQKLTLQRFQLETPGFDFSSASISGNYANGGPPL